MLLQPYVELCLEIFSGSINVVGFGFTLPVMLLAYGRLYIIVGDSIRFRRRAHEMRGLLFPRRISGFFELVPRGDYQCLPFSIRTSSRISILTSRPRKQRISRYDAQVENKAGEFYAQRCLQRNISDGGLFTARVICWPSPIKIDRRLTSFSGICCISLTLCLPRNISRKR